MTAALGNTAGGTPFATGVDAFVYPQFLGIPLRAPTTQDIYNPGTRWQDNSVNPPVIYETSGAGRWNTSTSGGSGIFTSLTVTPGPISLTGTTTINTSGAAATSIGTGGTGAVNIGNATGNTAVTGTLTTSGALTVSAGGAAITGTTNINTSGAAVTSIGTGGTGAVNIGNATGNTAVTGSLTASTILTATLGNITATNGNLVLSGAGNKLVIAAAAPTTDSVGTTGAMVGGAVTITSTAIAAGSKIIYSRRLLGTAMGNVSITAQVGGSATLTSDEGTETSTFDYIIIN